MLVTTFLKGEMEENQISEYVQAGVDDPVTIDLITKDLKALKVS
jgi:hypothetical protein